MSNTPNLEILQSSASMRGQPSGMRELPTVSKFIDTTTCIGCKACEVACQEWNDLATLQTAQVGSYQTLPSLDANFWNLIKFREQEHTGGLAWLMRKDQCMHCADPGCLRACPAPGAIVQYANGIVDVNPDACIGCGLCATGCPFDVPRFHAKTGKMAKCTLCVDRVAVGIEPACIKACPTGCLQFGTKEDMVALGNQRVAQLKQNGYPNAGLYDPAGVSGTGVVTVLGFADRPEWYELPADPMVPVSVTVNKTFLKPIGLAAILGTIAATFAHFLRFGPKREAHGFHAIEIDQRPPPHHQLTQARENEVVGDYVVRHSLSSRVIHWGLAVTFFGALLTGMPIWTPVFGWMATLFGGLSVCRWLHPWLGVAFFVVSIVMFVKWLAEMRFERKDWGWFGPKMVEYFRRTGDDPEVGKYNGGQKLFFFLVAALSLVLMATGVVLWFPLSFIHPLREFSWVLHIAGFILFAAAIVVHIYLGTAAVPGSFQSMTRGTVTKTYARLNHPRWYRETFGKADGDRKDDAKPGEV
jgi:formate dehydrogenase beta subunit/formate dehydrogenase gamma subunit